MERRMRGNSHVRCGAGEKLEIISKVYLLLLFGNNPYDIAEIWKKLLYRDGFIKCFNSVIFSVLDNSKEKVNINSFKEKFERGI